MLFSLIDLTDSLEGAIILLQGIILIGAIVFLMPQRVLYFFLIAKPLIDLAWRWSFFEVGNQNVNLQAITGFLVILVVTVIVLRKGKIYFNTGSFFLLIFATLSVLISPAGEGFNELIRLYSGVFLVSVAGFILSREQDFNRFAALFIAFVSVPVILSFLQLAKVLPFEYWDYIEGNMVGRVSGTYKHPLGLIYFLIFAIPLSLHLLSYSALSWYARVALWSFVVLSLLATLFTYHRVGIIAICLEIWLWLVLNKKYGHAALLAASGGLVIILLYDRFAVLYDNILDIARGEVIITSDQFLRGRGMNWYLFLSSIFNSPPLFWFFGLGGSVAEGWVKGFGYWVSQEPHNDYIRILHAYGLFGLIAYLSILITFYGRASAIRKSELTFNRSIGNLMIVALFAIVLLSFTTEPMRYPTASWYLFALGSVVLIRYREVQG